MLNNLNLSVFENGYGEEREWNMSLSLLANKTAHSKILEQKTEKVRNLHAQCKKHLALLDKITNKEDSDPKTIATCQKELKDLEKSCKLAKMLLPAISAHAYFEKGRGDSDPHTYLNTIFTDIDHISEELADKIVHKTKEFTYVLFACKSVRGEGVHLLSRVEVEGGINDDNFKEVFEVTTRIVESDLDIEADRSVGTISRFMFLNHDEQAYYNPEATPLNVDAALWLERNNINNFNFNNYERKR